MATSRSSTSEFAVNRNIGLLNVSVFLIFSLISYTVAWYSDNLSFLLTPLFLPWFAPALTSYPKYSIVSAVSWNPTFTVRVHHVCNTLSQQFYHPLKCSCLRNFVNRHSGKYSIVGARCKYILSFMLVKFGIFCRSFSGKLMIHSCKKIILV